MQINKCFICVFQTIRFVCLFLKQKKKEITKYIRFNSRNFLFHQNYDDYAINYENYSLFNNLFFSKKFFLSRLRFHLIIFVCCKNNDRQTYMDLSSQYDYRTLSVGINV